MRSMAILCDELVGFTERSIMRGFSGGRGERGFGPTLKKYKRYRVSEQYWSGFIKNDKSYQASIQFWVIIGTQAFCWRGDDDLLIVLFGYSHQRKKTLQSSTSSSKLSGSAHEHTH